jgi:hypothetical protein
MQLPSQGDMDSGPLAEPVIGPAEKAGPVWLCPEMTAQPASAVSVSRTQ